MLHHHHHHNSLWLAAAALALASATNIAQDQQQIHRHESKEILPSAVVRRETPSIEGSVHRRRANLAEAAGATGSEKAAEWAAAKKKAVQATADREAAAEAAII